MLGDRILFIDGEAIVLDKPAGLPVDAPRDGSLSLENHLAGLTFPSGCAQPRCSPRTRTARWRACAASARRAAAARQGLLEWRSGQGWEWHGAVWRGSHRRGTV